MFSLESRVLVFFDVLFYNFFVFLLSESVGFVDSDMIFLMDRGLFLGMGSGSGLLDVNLDLDNDLVNEVLVGENYDVRFILIFSVVLIFISEIIYEDGNYCSSEGSINEGLI